MMIVMIMMNIEQGISVRSPCVSDQFSRSRRSFRWVHLYIGACLIGPLCDKATFATFHFDWTNLLLTYLSVKGKLTTYVSPSPISLGGLTSRLLTQPFQNCLSFATLVAWLARFQISIEICSHFTSIDPTYWNIQSRIAEQSDPAMISNLHQLLRLLISRKPICQVVNIKWHLF